MDTIVRADPRPSSSPADPPRPGGRVLAILAALTALVAALHLVGIDWHLPHHAQPDEKVVHLQIQLARGESIGVREEVLARCYPPFLAWVSQPFVPGTSGESESSADASLAGLQVATSRDLVASRTVVAILSALLVPATWLLARRFLSDPWALLAAGLAASSTLAMWLSSQARPHALVVVFTTAVVAVSLRARASGRFPDFVVAGGLAALGIATLHSGAAACLSIAVAWLGCARPRWRAPLAGLIVATLLAGTSFLVLLVLPSSIERVAAGGEPRTVFDLLGAGAHDSSVSTFDGGGFLRLARTLRDHEPILALLAAVGVVALVAGLVAARRASAPNAPQAGRRAALWTAAAHPLAHVAVFGAFGESYQRFWLPIVPYLALLAAAGAARIATSASTRLRVAGGLVIAVLAGTQVALAVKLAVLRARDDTHELAARWVLAHPSDGPFVVSPGVHLPLVPRDPGYRAEFVGEWKYHVPWTTLTARLDEPRRARLAVDLVDAPLRGRTAGEQLRDDPSAWLDGLEGRSILLVRYPGRQRPPLRRVRDILLERGARLAAFEPVSGSGPPDPTLDYQQDSGLADEAGFAWRVWRAERLGPPIEAFRTPGAR